MKYFLVINSGSCNDGDHITCVDEYPTVEAAKEALALLRERYIIDSDAYVTLIHGEEVEL